MAALTILELNIQKNNIETKDLFDQLLNISDTFELTYQKIGSTLVNYKTDIELAEYFPKNVKDIPIIPRRKDDRLDVLRKINKHLMNKMQVLKETLIQFEEEMALIGNCEDDSFKLFSEFKSKKTRTTIFTRLNEINSGVGPFTRRLFELINDNQNIYSMSFRFYGPENYISFQSMPKALSMDDMKRKLNEYVVDDIDNEAFTGFMASDGSEGSDIAVNGYSLDMTYVRIHELITQGGSDYDNIEVFKHNNKHTKISTSNGFITETFKSTGNNCLIEIFRNYQITKNNVKPMTSNYIRKNILHRPKNVKLDLNDIKKLEEYFNVKCCCITQAIHKKIPMSISSSHKIPTIFYQKKNNHISAKDKHKLLEFKTKIKTIDTIIYPNIKYNRNDADFCINLANEHYSLIKRYTASRFCKYTGVVLKPGCKKLKTIQIARNLHTQKRIKLKKLNQTTSDLKEQSFLKEHNKVVKNKIKSYFIFDFETVYDNKGFLLPYSVSCCKYDENEKLIAEFFNGTDTCAQCFIKWLFRNRNQKHDNLLIGFNNARFDNYILVDALTQMELLKSDGVFLAGNSILKTTFDSFRTIDLCKFVNSSLKQACMDFKCEQQKTSLDHNHYQKMYFEKGHIAFFKNLEFNVDLKAYNLQDCKATANLYFKARKAFLKTTSLDINNFMTISQLGYQKFLNTKGSKLVRSPLDLKTWSFFRKACYAGRSQCFVRSMFENSKIDFNSFDVKSLYPFIMMCMPFPINQEIQTKKYIPNKLGIYSVRILKQPIVNIIPLRSIESPLNWIYEGQILSNLTTIDIDCILDYNGEVEFIEDDLGFIGYYWANSSTKVFAEYIESLKNEKTRQDKLRDTDDPRYNPSIRQICKLCLNCLSGKVIQKLYKAASKIVMTNLEVQKFIQKYQDIIITPCKGAGLFLRGNIINFKYNQKAAKPNHLGVFIYSYARRHMYDSIIAPLTNTLKKSHIENRVQYKSEYRVYQMDTDSAHCIDNNPILKYLDEYHKKTINIHEPSELFGRFVLGSEFGMFERELNFKTNDCYFISPKNYAYFGKPIKKDGIITIPQKTRLKGIGSRDKIINMTEKEYKKLTIKQQFNLFQKSESALSQMMYRKMVLNEPVNLICSQIKKVVSDKANNLFKLKQIFLFKKVNSNDL